MRRCQWGYRQLWRALPEVGGKMWAGCGQCDATMSVIVRGLGFNVVGGGDRSGELHSDDY
jgi:hypothetical protein